MTIGINRSPATPDTLKRFPKSLRLGKRIETQLLHFTGDGWGAYTYRWNDQQSDAELVPAEGADEAAPEEGAEKAEQAE